MKRKLRKSPNVYLAILACLVAVGASAVTMLRDDSSGRIESEDFTRVPVDWSVEETSVPLTFDANIGISGIADERIFIPETTVKIEENKPFSGSFAMPMGTDIIKDYSNGEMVYSKTMGDWRVHNGVDFSGSAGNDVRAVASGTVTKVFKDEFFGVVVTIDHENGILTNYANLQSEDFIKVGTKVKKGDIIGGVGKSGALEEMAEPHLHFEVVSNGEYKDPQEFLSN